MKHSIKFSRKSMYVIVEGLFILLPFFEPNYFKKIYLIHLVYTLWRVLSIVCIGCKCINKDVKKYMFPMLSFVCFFVCQIFSTYYNNGNYFSEFKADLYILAPCLYISLLFDDYQREVINVLSIIMGIILLIQALTIFIFPNGLYVESIYNRYPYWFWDSAGHMSSLAFVYTVVLKIADLLYGGKYKIYMTVHIILYMFLFGIYFKDYGNLFGFIIVAAGCLAPMFWKKFKFDNAFIWWLVILLLNIGLIGFNIQNYFAGIIENVFRKELTLSGRTYIWQSAISVIKSHFWIGKGDAARFGYAGWCFINGRAYAAHNQLLQIFVNGGLVSLIAILLVELNVVVSICKCENVELRTVLSMALMGCGVTMLNDTFTPLLPLFILFLFALNIKKLLQINYKQ